MLEEGRHRHGPGCAHAQPVQRSAVHDVIRSAGRPLDGETLTEMEARFGADFGSVRLHTDAAAQRSAAEIGARAYTSGDHVVIGQGGADKHTLAHELTHVVQQRQGPVAGTDNGAGLRVSDPSDRFEREAEANAHRVLAGDVPAGSTREATAKSDAARAHPSAVQRTTKLTKDDLDSDRAKSPFTRTIALLRSRGEEEKAAKLERQLSKKIPEIIPETVVFKNEMIEQSRHGQRHRLTLATESNRYYAAQNLGKKEYGPPALANGTYNFVIPAHKPTKVIASQEGDNQEGHSALSKARYVYYAGTATFRDGELLKWSNDSGHYKPDAAQAGQPEQVVGTGFLPQDLFQGHQG
ncbi:DUF4157 domain-containing protein [Streptomyces sp. NPDC051907]|uniref:eCIS core domain-containing protein n=1 Tax=Streptomyces sp. NPDC051907 TaxID=3155284 RepID=UPI0034368E69